MNKCSSKIHENNEANKYCQECKIYMCNKCENFHSILFQNHHLYKLEKETKELFTGYCTNKNHINKLEYFCKDHNQLFCVACISKIIGKDNGQHTDCDICLIEDIKEEKKDKLSENLKNLEDLYKTIEESINKLKKIYEKINLEKEELKIFI